MGGGTSDRHLAADATEELGARLEHGGAAGGERTKLVRLDEVAEEETQQPFVTQLKAVRLVAQPLLELGTPQVGQRVDAPAHLAARLVARIDEPAPLQTAQLGVDLSVACAPEETGRPVGDTLDLVSGARIPGEETEDHAGCRAHG